MTEKEYREKGYYKLADGLIKDGFCINKINQLLLIGKEKGKSIKMTAKKSNLFIG